MPLDNNLLYKHSFAAYRSSIKLLKAGGLIICLTCVFGGIFLSGTGLAYYISSTAPTPKHFFPAISDSKPPKSINTIEVSRIFPEAGLGQAVGNIIPLVGSSAGFSFGAWIAYQNTKHPIND